jgi:hypothetical protein
LEHDASRDVTVAPGRQRDGRCRSVLSQGYGTSVDHRDAFQAAIMTQASTR